MKKGRGLFGLAAVLSGFYVMGFCDIAGFSASYMQEEFSLSETVSGVIPSMVFLWFLLLSMPVAVVMNRIGRKKTVLAGYAFSSIFSVIYSQALKHRPEYANEISGLMITGVFGGAVVPPLMGISADLTGSQVGSLLILLLFAIYLLTCVRAYEKESS